MEGLEVAHKDGIRTGLLSAMLDPYLFILGSYLTLVVTLLVWLTRSAIVDDLVSIPSLPRSVKNQLAKVGISLIATWYYMIKYMLWSYSAFVERISLTGGELTTIPQCGSGFGCKQQIAAAKLLRVSSWLRETSLFEEAWLHVVGGRLNWWWSVEICTFTVGVMALHFRTQDKKKAIPHLWAYMLLGQTVAISVAWNLFETAIVMRKWLFIVTGAFSKASLQQHDVGEETVASAASKDNDVVPSSDLSDEEEDDASTSSLSGQSSSEPSSPQSPFSTFTWTDIKIYSPPRYGDLLFSLVMVSAGLTSVLRTPTSLWPILVMHLCPLLLLLPIPLPAKLVSRRWRGIIATSSIYAVIAAYSVIIRLKAHWDAWPNFDLLLSTFISHPAQSSISADVVCLTLTVVEKLYYGFKSRKLPTWTLLVLIPFFGPSAVLAALYALDSKEEQVTREPMWEKMGEQEVYQKTDMLVKTEVITTYPVSQHNQKKTN